MNRRGLPVASQATGHTARLLGPGPAARILDDPSSAAAASRLGDQLRTESGSGAALAELEGLARRDRSGV